jgi:hypothetical protein
VGNRPRVEFFGINDNHLELKPLFYLLHRLLEIDFHFIITSDCMTLKLHRRGINSFNEDIQHEP